MSRNILLMYSNHSPSRGHIKRLEDIAQAYTVEVVASGEEAVELAAKAEIIFGHRFLRQVLPFAKNLKWVQTTAGGIDRLPWQELKERNILLTRHTIPSRVIAQHAFSLAWAIIRRLPECFSLQKQHIWRSDIEKEFLPLPKTALILGLGEIGKELARILKVFNIKVWSVKRKEDELSKELCDRLFTDDTWKIMLSEVDLCFLTVPLNKETKHLCNAAMIYKLPKHAVIVNVAREEIVDTQALIEALKKGHLGGAALDVIEGYPLSGDDPIWDTPRLIISPYVAARYQERAEETERFFEKQLKCFLTNQKSLENITYWHEN